MAKKKKPATKKEAGRKSNKNMVRVSDEDHAILVALAKEHGRLISGENHQALADYFRKHGVLPPGSAKKPD